MWPNNWTDTITSHFSHQRTWQNWPDRPLFNDSTTILCIPRSPLFGSIQRAISPNALYQWLQNQLPVIIVSDASVQKDEQSGFMWIITNENTKLWQGQGLAPGPAEDMHSGHAEAFGILAALTFFCSYIACYDPLPDMTAIQCFCDNLGVITNIIDIQTSTILWPNDTMADDCDLLLAIRE